MIRKKIENRKGFSLVEVMAASFLSGLLLLTAFPLLTVGRNLIEYEQRKIEASGLGNRIFLSISDVLNDFKTYAYGEEDLIEAVLKEADLVEMEQMSEKYGFELSVEMEELDPAWMRLKICLNEDGAVWYEREEVVTMLNGEIWKIQKGNDIEKDFFKEE